MKKISKIKRNNEISSLFPSLRNNKMLINIFIKSKGNNIAKRKSIIKIKKLLRGEPLLLPG